MEVESTPAQNQDASNYDALLERALELEEWHGIQLDHLSAIYSRSEHKLTIYCEMRPLKGAKLKHNISISVVVYDANDRIINREHILVRKEEFYGFEVEQITLFDLTPKKIAAFKKIKVYPATW